MNPTKAILLITFCALTHLLNGQQVIISEDANPSGHPSAILDIQADDKGLLIPRVTTAVRDTMNSAPDGMLVFDSDLGALFCKSGGAWEKLEMPNNVFESVGGRIKQTAGYDTDDFVFGSPLLYYVGNYAYSSRFFFDKAKSAFRAGYSQGFWNSPFVGNYSFASGYETKASGSTSTAFGSHSTASGDYSTAFGHYTTASGDFSTAFGFETEARASNTLTSGFRTIANTQNLAVVGQNNDPLRELNDIFNDYPHFIVGNGSNVSRSNALAVYNSGKVALGNIDPTEILDIDGSIRMREGAAAGYVPVSDAGGAMTWTDPSTLGLSPWMTAGGNIYRSSGNVGIGTTTPSVPLDIFTENAPGLDTMVKFRNSLGGPNDLLFFSNASIYNNFSPMMQGRVDDNNIAALYIQANSSEDLANGSPMMVFSSRKLDSNVSNRPLYHWRNYNSTLMAMTANGNLGINTSDPQEKLHIIGNSRIQGGLTLLNPLQAMNAFGLQFATDEGLVRMAIKDDGQVQINEELGVRTNPQTDLHIFHYNVAQDENAGLRLDQGNNQYWTINMHKNLLQPDIDSDLHFYYQNTEKARINYSTGAYVQGSDLKLKKDISLLTNVLSAVLSLNAKQYLYKDQIKGDQKSYGFIAQEVQEIFPDAVYTNPSTGMLSLNYDVFGVLAIQAIKEQQEIINDQEKRIVELERKLEKVLALLED